MATGRATVVAFLGAGILFLGLVILLNLPKVTPYEFFSCGAAIGGGEQCFGSMNPIYLAVFIFSIAGVAVLFWGLFGRAFVLGPFFGLGMIVAAFGLAGVVLGYVGFESCGAGALGRVMSCMAYHPELFDPYILVGGSLVSCNAYLWFSSTSSSRHWDRRTRVRFSGWVLAFFGANLLLSGWAVVGSFVGRFVADEVHWEFWIEAAVGLAILIAGMALVLSVSYARTLKT